MYIHIAIHTCIALVPILELSDHTPLMTPQQLQYTQSIKTYQSHRHLSILTHPERVD